MTWDRTKSSRGNGYWLICEAAEFLSVLVVDGTSPPRGTTDGDGDGFWRLVLWHVNHPGYPVIDHDAPDHVYRVTTTYVLKAIDPAHHAWVRSTTTQQLRRLQLTLSSTPHRITDDDVARGASDAASLLAAELQDAWPYEQWQAPPPEAEDLPTGDQDLIALLPANAAIGLPVEHSAHANAEDPTLVSIGLQALRVIRRRAGRRLRLLEASDKSTVRPVDGESEDTSEFVAVHH